MPKPPPPNPFVQAALLNRLRTAEGGVVSIDELARRIWGAAQVDDAPNSLRQAARALRQRGFPVTCQYGRGYRFVPTEACGG